MYTTKLLAIMDDVMPRRQRIVLGAVVAFLALASIVSSRPTERTIVQPAIIIIATTRPAGAVGTAKEAGRTSPMGETPTTPAPTPTTAPTVEPIVIILVATAAPPTAAPAPTAAPPPPAHVNVGPPPWTIK